MKVSIVIVSWNVKSYLSECIESIENFPTKYDYEVIVVDNDSHDGTVEHIRNQFPDVKVLDNKENLGFARANNQGAASATGEYYFILNPDTLFLEGTIDNLVDFMDQNPGIAMCGPRILNDDGTVQRSVRNFQTWKAAFCSYSPLKYFGVFKSDLNHWRCRDFNFDVQSDVEQLIGAAILIRREVFEQFDGFDELFFMYYEEVDLCYRVKTSGLRNVFYPGAEIIHLGGKSSKQVPAKKQFMLLQSLLRYLEKHTSSSKAGILSVLFKVGVLALQIYEMLFYYVGYLLSALTFNRKKKSKCYGRYRSAFDFITKYYVDFVRG